MTTATQVGRQLVLTVDGIDEPFRVDPLPAKRGRVLTETYMRIATSQQITAAESEALFIEAINPQNYARMAGAVVDEFDAAGAYVRTWGPDGILGVHEQLREATSPTARYVAREAAPAFGEPEWEGEAIRQDECEQLSLCAFYWQSVVGIEAVDAFLQGGGGTAGSLKALNLLLIRLGRSVSPNSSQQVTESLMGEVGSEETTSTASSSASVRLPANKRGFRQNPLKVKPRRG